MRASIFTFFTVILKFPVRDSSSPWLEITRDYQRLLKITRITGLPEITKITMRLLKITKITKDYQGLPGITKDYQGLPGD